MTDTKKSILATVAILVPALGTLALGFAVGYQQAHMDGLPACTTEDSHNCVWDARIHGNGEGRSFVDIDGQTYYLEK